MQLLPPRLTSYPSSMSWFSERLSFKSLGATPALWRQFMTPWCMILAFMLSLFSQGAGAGSLRDTLSETISSAGSVTNSTWRAASFSTTATEHVITDVVLKLRRSSDNLEGNFTIDIYSSSNNLPADLVANVYTGAANQLTSLTSYADFSPTINTPINLTPSTDYFLVLRGETLTDGYSIRWANAGVVGSSYI